MKKTSICEEANESTSVPDYDQKVKALQHYVGALLIEAKRRGKKCIGY